MAGRFESLTLAGISTAQPGRTIFVARSGAVRQLSFQVVLTGTTEAVVQPEVSINGVHFTALGAASTVSTAAALLGTSQSAVGFSHARLTLASDTTDGGTVAAWLVGS